MELWSCRQPHSDDRREATTHLRYDRWNANYPITPNRSGGVTVTVPPSTSSTS